MRSGSAIATSLAHADDLSVGKSSARAFGMETGGSINIRALFLQCRDIGAAVPKQIGVRYD
jgi:hypothetical protein